MKILGISHIGIVPKDIGVAKSFFETLLQLPAEGGETVADQGVHVDFVQAGASRLEFLTPTHADSPIAKFLNTRGAGIQHVALRVDNLQEWLNYLKGAGVPLIDEVPRQGAHHAQIAFIHPRATGGVLVELTQEKEESLVCSTSTK